MGYVILRLTVILFSGMPVQAALTTPPVPSFDAEKQSHQCWVVRDGISCKFNEQGSFSIGGINQPLTVMVGWHFQCVLTVDRVRCFVPPNHYRMDQQVEAEVPPLKNPRQLTGGGYSVCALDDNGAHCWSYPRNGSNWIGEMIVVETPNLALPRMLAAGWGYFCAIEFTGTTCAEFGNFKRIRLLEVPSELQNSDRIGVDGRVTCATDDNQTRCWDFGARKFIEDPASFIRKSAHIQRDFAAFDSRPVVNKAHSAFNLDQIDYLVDLLSTVSPPARAQFFADLKTSVMKSAVDPRSDHLNRYLVLRLIEPAIQGNTSPYFSQKLLPQFNNSLTAIELELGKTNISSIPKTDRNRQASLRIMLAAHQVLIKFVPVEEKDAFANIPRLIGHAVLDSQSTDSLLRAIEGLDSRLQKLETNPKAAFLVTIIRLTSEWLKEN